MTQWRFPATSSEWTEQVKSDLARLEIPQDLIYIETKTKGAFKSIVKIKTREFAFMTFMNKKESHSKMENLWYPELKMQEYLKCDKISTAEAKAVFSYRTRMANYSNNYRGLGGLSPCPLCYLHLDVQSLGFQCSNILENVKILGKYEDIFEDNISKDLAKTVLQISTYRSSYLEERRIEE